MENKKTNTSQKRSRTGKTSQRSRSTGAKSQSRNTGRSKSRKTSRGEQTNTQKEQAFWEETKENISEGAKIVGDMFSEYSEKFMSTLKDKTLEAYKFSSELTLETVQKAQQTIDEYRDRFEVKKLSEKRDALSAKLGLHFYHTIKGNDGHLPENYMKDKSVTSLLQKIESVDAEIIDLKPEDLNK